jgi:glycosyltransferase involved in cell wall biosynthesis
VKILDYLACGRPVIASAIPSVSTTFGQEAGVVFVSPDDASVLAQAVMVLLKDPDRQSRMSYIGRHFVEQAFSWGNITNRLRECLAAEQASIHHAHPRIL